MINNELYRLNAIKNKDLNMLDNFYKIESPILNTMTIKEYGKVLNLDIRNINLKVWLQLGNKIHDFNDFGDELVKRLPQYKEEFIKFYLIELSSEYIIQKDSNFNSEEEYKQYEDENIRFNKLILDFKYELLEAKKLENYILELKQVKEYLEKGNFKIAFLKIKSIDYKSKFDKLNLISYYNQAIDIYSLNKNLNNIKDKIIFESELQFKCYRNFTDEY